MRTGSSTRTTCRRPTPPSRRSAVPATPQLESSGGVTTLELFFDLVFVFALTQLTSVLRDASGAADVVQAALVLVVLWWMYDGFAWMTNNVATASTPRRLLVLLGMGAFLVAAVAVPDAFGYDGVLFGLAYLALVLIHAGLFTLAQSRSSARAILHVLPFNVAVALLVLAAGWVSGPADFVLWGAAVAILAAALLRRVETGFDVRPTHFAERHGLIVIIALGESVVEVGVGAEGRLHNGAAVVTALLSLALAATMWWLYFGGDDKAGARALTSMTEDNRARRALHAYTLGILLMVAGIVVVAAGLETAVAHPRAHMSAWAAASLAGGVATYLLGLGLFRRLLRLPDAWLRPAVAVPVVATAALGLATSGAAQVLAITAILVLTVVRDTRRAPAPTVMDA
jgi:low temperature requirement protein LtrA